MTKPWWISSVPKGSFDGKRMTRIEAIRPASCPGLDMGPSHHSVLCPSIGSAAQPLLPCAVHQGGMRGEQSYRHWRSLPFGQGFGVEVGVRLSRLRPREIGLHAALHEALPGDPITIER
jgi:hypothetical protein